MSPAQRLRALAKRTALDGVAEELVAIAAELDQRPAAQTEREAHEPNAKLMELADRIDHEQLWRLSGLDQMDLPQEKQDRVLAGVMLRRYADLLGKGGWRIFPPRSGVSFRASTLDKVVEMARHDEARRASLPAPQQATPGALTKAWDDGYRLGVEDERNSEANIGVAGFGAKVNPARQNPYLAQQATPESVGEPFGWWFTEDPAVFSMPGSGFRRFPNKPQHTVECVPLYTHAAQPEPMTRRQQCAAFQASPAIRPDFFDGIRAAEAHHGITAQAKEVG